MPPEAFTLAVKNIFILAYLNPCLHAFGAIENFLIYVQFGDL